MSAPDGSAHLATRNHLLVTDTVAARGTVWPCRGRLADHLRETGRGMITVRDVEITPRSGGATEHFDEVRLPIPGLLLAHEYVDLGSDPHYRRMRADDRERRVRLVFSRPDGLVLEGAIMSGTLDTDTPPFLALGAPRVQPTSGENLAFWKSAVRGLPYILVNRDVVGALILLDGPEEKRP